MYTIITFLKDIVNYTRTLFPQVLEGLKVTMEIFLLTLILSIPLGALVALGRLSKIKIINKLTGFYVLIMRGTPLLLQIVFIFFGLPNLNIVIDRFPAAIIAFTLNYAAYFGEIFRAGIQSIDKGQFEAGRSLGLTWSQTMRKIVIPQAFRRTIPQLGNEFIAMLKDSSLVSVIGFEELTRKGQLIIAATYRSFEIWTAVAIIYLIMTLTISRLVAYLEKKYNSKGH